MQDASHSMQPTSHNVQPKATNASRDTQAARPQDIVLVVGLGNPGDKYQHTRHNAGFRAIDAFARAQGVSYWKNQAGAYVASLRCAGREIILAKPQSYMNKSGGPVNKLAQLYDVLPEEILVIHDELDIPEGDVRIKFGGGHGGHNGLRSIMDKIGSRNFSRVRVGIGRPPGRMDPANYVLRELSGGAALTFAETVEYAAEAIANCIEQGVVSAQQHHNTN